MVNGKAARSQGLELEVEAQVTDRLTASIGGSYADARLTSDFVAANFVGFKNDPLPLVPKTQLTLALDYALPLPRERELTFHVDGSYRSAVNTAVNDRQATTDADGNITIAQDLYATNFRHLGGFTTVDAGIALKTSEHLRLRVYVNNVTNQQGITTWAVARDPTQSFEYVMRPRTAGASIEYSFK